MLTRSLLAVAVIAGTMATGAAFAASTGSSHLSAQDNKMKTCAAEYHTKNLPSNQYKSFMSECLKKDYNANASTAAAKVAPAAGTTATAAAPATQQTRMKTCNADAKTKKLSGADRKTFMKTCLSSK